MGSKPFTMASSNILSSVFPWAIRQTTRPICPADWLLSASDVPSSNGGLWACYLSPLAIGIIDMAHFSSVALRSVQLKAPVEGVECGNMNCETQLVC
jgi:hypothetical protein